MTESATSFPPAPGLRERKKAATMRHIQAVALALFSQNGFDHITIEQVAEAAEVSPSTIYRYFGTKEGLVLHDEFDDQVMAGLTHFLEQELSPWQAAMAAFDYIEEGHFVDQEEATRARIRLWSENPSVQAAALLSIDRTVEQAAQAMASTGRWTFSQARVIVSSIVWPFLSAMKNWNDAADSSPLRKHVEEAITTLQDAAPR